MKPSVALVSLGCARNLVDSEVMLGFLAEAGYPIVEDNEDAQVVIVNTCAFIEPAVDEAIEALLDVDDLLEELSEVDVFLTPGAVGQIVEAVQLALSGQRAVMKAPLEYIYDAQTPRWRSAPSWLAYLKIAEGCDNRCAYCTIPSLRGRHRSRPVDDICDEFSNLAGNGVREIVLIAHDTTRYGAEMEPPSSLAALLGSLPTRDYNGWIRIMYMYPTRITTNLINSMGQSICTVPYFDIPFQHASGDILRHMGRAGDGEVYLNELAQIRQIIPEVAFRTTLIAGLPGETEEDFELLLDFVREAHFDRLGVFPYWPEPGTPAAEMEGQVPPELARERQAELILVQEEISLEKNEQFVGQMLRVLVEREVEPALWAGRSYRDAPEVDGEVVLRAGGEGPKPVPGEFVWATVTKAQVHDLEAVVER